jgi:hypothetical protein
LYPPLENSTTRIAITEGLNEKSADTGTMLHEEWKNMYPQSTFNARNIKSRLTVYLKTMGDNAGSPAKRRKIVSHSESTAIKTTTTSQNPSLANSKEVSPEVTDEFAPDTPEDTFENNIEAELPPVKAELYSICDSNHWVHLFSDQDVKVECILTEQVN